MNSIEVSKLFPSGTVIVAYKGEIFGGAKVMPKWEIEPIIDESQHLRSNDKISANLKVENLITMEFNTVDPQHSASRHEFDDTSGKLTFVPLDPEKKVAYSFPLVLLKDKFEIEEKNSILWKFKILYDANGYSCKK